MQTGGVRTGCETALPNLGPRPETSKRKGAGASLRSSSWEFRCLQGGRAELLEGHGLLTATHRGL